MKGAPKMDDIVNDCIKKEAILANLSGRNLSDHTKSTVHTWLEFHMAWEGIKTDQAKNDEVKRLLCVAIEALRNVQNILQ